MSTELASITRTVHRARRRLFANRLLNTLGWGLAAGLALGLVWFLAEPWILDSSVKWYVLGGTTLLGALVAIALAILKRPSADVAALEVDGRFGLNERVTTVLLLPEADRASLAGQAVLMDAASQVTNIKVGEKFPVRPRRSGLLVPLFAGLIAATVFFYDPDTSSSAFASEGDGTKKTEGKLAAKDKKTNNAKPFTQLQKPPEQRDRATKSQELKDLEQELDKLMDKWAKDPADAPEKQREKLSELTAMEEKLKKFEMEKAQKLEALESKLSKLDKLNHDKDFADGPAEKLNDALSKGDLKKAEEEIDELKKKAKEKKLDKNDLQKLNRQMKDMKDEAERLARNKEEQKKLKDKLDKAKQEGRDKDAESLQRELDKMEQESKESSEMMEQLAERCKKCQQAIDKGDLEELAQQLDAMKSDLKDIEGELEDIEDAENYLQRLKEEMKKACKGCNGEGQEKSEMGGGGKGYAEGGFGEREENKDAKSTVVDERLRGLFDPKGKKSYGGSTRGPAFTKKSSVEIGQEIQTAVQEASKGIDSQNVPRDAKAAVKEYMEKIGGTAGK